MIYKKMDEFLRLRVIRAAKKYYDFVYKKQDKGFKPGDRICYGGRIFDDKEISCLIDASLDFWLTAGRFSSKFEKNLAQFLHVRYCSLVNSGSSSNLLAFMALTSPELGDRRIMKGDEVITVAAGFPTTVAPIIQYGAVPVFIDVEIPGCNLDCSQLEQAVSPRTKAVMAAHTLGNPFDLEKVKAFCDRHQLWLIEDNCDSLGTRVLINGNWQYTGTVGDIGTSSFYPPHHITTGEGGAVYTNDSRLKQLVDSYRDWGRDCRCPPGQDNLCGKRFTRKFSQLPLGYDHKYVYSHFGYNFKMTEMQAAVGCAQLDKLNSFMETRRRNWKFLHDALADLSYAFVFPEPALNSDPSWFGFLMIVKEEAGFTRDEIVDYLEAAGIQTRMLFAGNLTKHPCFDEMRAMGEGYRIAGELKNTDTIMEQAFWIGVYPGMSYEKLDYVVTKIRGYMVMR
jgi:CDP-6-deoxy-D-xylo-4-hexulose-3-dehydrase